MGIEIEEPTREAFVCDTLFKKYHRHVHADWHEDLDSRIANSSNLCYHQRKEIINQ